jgi:hypothetical protein
MKDADATMPGEREPTRLQELLVDRALGETDPADVRELDAALRDASASTAARQLECCCAAALLGETAPAALPAGLRQKLFQQGCACLEAAAASQLDTSRTDTSHPNASHGDTSRTGTSRIDTPGEDTPIRLPVRPGERAASSAGGLSRWVGYAGWLAAAAAIAVMVYPRLGDRPATPNNGNAVATALPMPEQLDRFMRDAPDVQMINWVSPSGAVRCQGDVCWSQVRQRGYMRFTGLPRNDPSQVQYQLWIFDAERPEATPVDGGVFNVDREDGMVIVPIDAKLPIHRASAFAITRERPGGVVVSDRKDLVLLAAK